MTLQLALTQAIKNRQRQLEAELLDRSPWPFSITPYGNMLLDCALDLKKFTDDLPTRIEALRTGSVGVLPSGKSRAVPSFIVFSPLPRHNPSFLYRTLLSTDH